MRVWEPRPGWFVVSGAFSDLAVHHHAALQIEVGTRGPLTVIGPDGACSSCRLMVIAGGTRHAVRSDARSGALTIYLGSQVHEGAVLNAASRIRTRQSGTWMVDNSDVLADATASVVSANGPCAAAEFLVDELCGAADAGSEDKPSRPSVHPQLRQAMDLLSRNASAGIGLASVAEAVALSPDYLGRLCRAQTGASFSATARWARLVAAMRYLVDGESVTDAAHLAGFTDGAHFNRVCWEMTGAAPSAFMRALGDQSMPV